jgi:hypothetical protein
MKMENEECKLGYLTAGLLALGTAMMVGFITVCGILTYRTDFAGGAGHYLQ